MTEPSSGDEGEETHSMAGFWAHVDDDAFPWSWVCNSRKGGDSGLGVPVDHAAKMTQWLWHIQLRT